MRWNPGYNTRIGAERVDDWRDDAACREYEPDLFFPSGNTGLALVQIDDAKAVCRRCPVVERCLQWALESGIEFGVWGGLSEGERRAKRRGAARRPQLEPVDALAYTRTGSLEEACRELYDRYTAIRDGGHLVWIAEKLSAKIAYRDRTFGQICFQAGRGRWPDGPVYRTCDEHHCVAPEHLTDTTIRKARKQAAARREEALQAAVGGAR